MKRIIMALIVLVFCTSCTGNGTGGSIIDKNSSACLTAADCGPSQFCRKEPGACDSEGTCAEKPQACTMIYDPVCGCDGRAYSSECMANGAGVNVRHRGECAE